MKKNLMILLLFVAGSLSAQKITVIESEARITFNFTDDDVDGTFGGFQFTGNIDLDALQNSVLSGSVETRSIDTNNWLRSRHLRTKKFFNARDFPKLKFKSSSISGVKEGFQVKGTLEIKGIEKQVVWNFKNDGNQLTGSLFINTSDFDISIHEGKDRNKVKVSIILPYK